MTSIVGFVKDALAPTTKLFFNLPIDTFWEGDTVEGELIVISLEFPYQAEIILELNGIVEVSAPVNLAYRMNAKDMFMCQSAVIFKGQITKRQEAFPFKAVLPKTTPGSFKYNQGRDYANVYYYAQATLKVPYRIDRKVKQTVNVREKQKDLAVPIRAHSRVNFFLNSVGVSVWLDRNVYYPGEVIIARLKINNTSNATLPNMQIRLVHGVEIKGHGICLSYHPHITGIAPPAPFHCGTMWTQFKIQKTVELSSRGTVVSSVHFLQIDFNDEKHVSVPITILARHSIQSLHPFAPPSPPLPPPTSYRPPLQTTSLSCTLCGVEFGLLKKKINCRHCGKLFCKECARDSTRIKKLMYPEKVRVCRPCMRVVEETGGIKYQKGKQILEEWSKLPGVQWVPKCSKGAFKWVEVESDTKCFIAISSNQG